MKLFLLSVIGLYQKWVSPIKGFSCAHHIYFGRSTCSVYGKRAISKHGAWSGVRLIFRRLRACSRVMKTIENEAPEDENPKKKKDEEMGKCLIAEGMGEVACCSVLSIFS